MPHNREVRNEAVHVDKANEFADEAIKRANSLERAVENGVKRGSARTKEWIGKERRGMNQLISGTISLNTLRWLLG